MLMGQSSLSIKFLNFKGFADQAWQLNFQVLSFIKISAQVINIKKKIRQNKKHSGALLSILPNWWM
jgi:hypothetical protein